MSELVPGDNIPGVNQINIDDEDDGERAMIQSTHHFQWLVSPWTV